MCTSEITAYITSNHCVVPVWLSGSTAGHSDGSVPAVYPKYIRSHSLPADDVDGRYRRCLRLLHNCLHVLLNSE